MSLDLKPGDLCEILPVTYTEPWLRDVAKRLAGRAVILLRISPTAEGNGRWAPYWLTTNTHDLDPKGVGISHEILRKLPPPLTEERLRQETEEGVPA
jgi:hypothetical protein